MFFAINLPVRQKHIINMFKRNGKILPIFGFFYVQQHRKANFHGPLNIPVLQKPK